MINTEIHVPVSLNENFAVMSAILVRSLARRAQLPGDWRVVFTVSLDSELSADSPSFLWTRSYPVEFRFVTQERWDHYGYDGTGLQSVMYDHTADVILLMDADTVVAGSIGELVRRVADSNAVHGWPAWYPPPVDLAQVLDTAGAKWRDCGLTFSGYGIDFISPKSCPPYFNGGFLAVPRSLVAQIGRTLPHDLEFVFEHFPNRFAFQIALCLNIVRNDYDFVALDERYNLGNSDLGPPKFQDPESLALRAKSLAAMNEPRVVHYCVSTESFQKRRDLASWAAARAFCRRPGLGDGHVLLQNALKDLLFD